MNRCFSLLNFLRTDTFLTKRTGGVEAEGSDSTRSVISQNVDSNCTTAVIKGRMHWELPKLNFSYFLSVGTWDYLCTLRR